MNAQRTRWGDELRGDLGANYEQCARALRVLVGGRRSRHVHSVDLAAEPRRLERQDARTRPELEQGGADAEPVQEVSRLAGVGEVNPTVAYFVELPWGFRHGGDPCRKRIARRAERRQGAWAAGSCES